MESTPKKIMKVEPPKDYKKPLYACAVAASLAITSMAVTGCDDPISLLEPPPTLQGFVTSFD